MTELTLFNIHHDCLTLSPVPSTVFYAEGCRFRCRGCLYWEAHDNLTIFTMPADKAAASVIEHGSECVVLSGGNPLLQAEAFLELVETVRAAKDVGVILYCGETREELDAIRAKDCPEARLLAHADVIISGRYEPENDVGNARVGSTNQRVDFMTERYSEYRDMYEVRDRRIEVELSFGDIPGLSYSGVPSAEQRRFFEGICKGMEEDTPRACPGNVGIHRLSEDTCMLTMGGGSLAYIRTDDDKVRMDLNSLTEEQIGPLIDAFLYLTGGGEDV